MKIKKKVGLFLELLPFAKFGIEKLVVKISQELLLCQLIEDNE